jgi:hypothetical protein
VDKTNFRRYKKINIHYIMPYGIRKLPNKQLYRVYNKDTKKVHAEATTLDNAKKQVRLLYSLENPKGKAMKGGMIQEDEDLEEDIRPDYSVYQTLDDFIPQDDDYTYGKRSSHPKQARQPYMSPTEYLLKTRKDMYNIFKRMITEYNENLRRNTQASYLQSGFINYLNYLTEFIVEVIDQLDTNNINNLEEDLINDIFKLGYDVNMVGDMFEIDEGGPVPNVQTPELPPTVEQYFQLRDNFQNPPTYILEHLGNVFGNQQIGGGAITGGANSPVMENSDNDEFDNLTYLSSVNMTPSTISNYDNNQEDTDSIGRTDLTPPQSPEIPQITEEEEITEYLQESLRNVFQDFKDFVNFYNTNRNNFREAQYFGADINQKAQYRQSRDIWWWIRTNYHNLGELHRSVADRILELEHDMNTLINYLSTYKTLGEMPSRLRPLPTSIVEYFRIRNIYDTEQYATPGRFILGYNAQQILADTDTSDLDSITIDEFSPQQTARRLLFESDTETTPQQIGQRRGREDEELPPSQRPRGGAISEDERSTIQPAYSDLSDESSISSFPTVYLPQNRVFDRRLRPARPMPMMISSDESVGSLPSQPLSYTGDLEYGSTSGLTQPFNRFLTNRLYRRPRSESTNSELSEMSRFGEFLSSDSGSSLASNDAISESSGSVPERDYLVRGTNREDLQRDIDIMARNINRMRTVRPRTPSTSSSESGDMYQLIGNRRTREEMDALNEIEQQIRNMSDPELVLLSQNTNPELVQEVQLAQQELMRRRNIRPRGGAIKSRMIVSIGNSKTCYPSYNR